MIATDTAVGNGDYRQQCRNLLLGFTNEQNPTHPSFLSSLSRRVRERPICAFLTMTGRAGQHNALIYQSCSPANGKRLYSGGGI